VSSITFIDRFKEEPSMSYYDKLVTDLQHKIEFGKFNVCDGYKVMKQLQEALQERRKVKDERELLEPLIRYTGTLEKKVEAIHNDISDHESRMENRKYRPRVLQAI
jgi:hypothetical protein